MKNKKDLIRFLLGFLIIVLIIGFYYFNKNINYSNEIAKQELVLKCQQIYEIKHKDLEVSRYDKELKADAMIWSPKTKSCLAYYNTNLLIGDSLFEVWDYSNDDLVLKFLSFKSEDCRMDNVVTYKTSFIYKLNNKLEGDGCAFTMRKDNGVDLLNNFEDAMEDLGFRK
jgi:hypothetical protein